MMQGLDMFYIPANGYISEVRTCKDRQQTSVNNIALYWFLKKSEGFCCHKPKRIEKRWLAPLLLHSRQHFRSPSRVLVIKVPVSYLFRRLEGYNTYFGRCNYTAVNPTCYVAIWVGRHCIILPENFPIVARNEWELTNQVLQGQRQPLFVFAPQDVSSLPKKVQSLWSRILVSPSISIPAPSQERAVTNGGRRIWVVVVFCRAVNPMCIYIYIHIYIYIYIFIYIFIYIPQISPLY